MNKNKEIVLAEMRKVIKQAEITYCIAFVVGVSCGIINLLLLILVILWRLQVR